MGWISGAGNFVNGGNAQANAGGGMTVAALGTLTHEITHELQAHAPAQYQALQDEITKIYFENDPALFADRVHKWMREGGDTTLSEQEATDEVIANSCMRMLGDSDAIAQVVADDENLARKILSTIKAKISSILNRMKAIYAEDRFYQQHKAEFEKARQLWADAFAAAAENAQRENGVENGIDTTVQYMKIGTNEYGEEAYQTTEQLQGLSYSQKIDMFKENFYTPGSPHYLGQRVRFQTKNGTYYAEIDRQTQRENIKKINPGRLNQTDKAKINIGAAGDFVTLLENARIDQQNVPTTKKNNDAKKGVTHFDYALKNVEIDGKRFKVIINIRKTQGGKYVYEVKLSPIKENPSFGPQQGNTQHRPARQQPLHRGSDKTITQQNQESNKESDRQNKTYYQLLPVDEVEPSGDAIINDQNILYLNEDKKRTRDWFQVCDISVPLNGTKFGLIRSIQYVDKKAIGKSSPGTAFPRLSKSGRSGKTNPSTQRRRRPVLR